MRPPQLMAMMKFIVRRVAAWCWLAGLLPGPSWAHHGTETAAHQDTMSQVVPGVFTEVHQLLVTLQQNQSQLVSLRHKEEKARLMASLDQSKGPWTETHARYRLLSALHAFTRYEERQRAELARLRKLHKGVSKAQKAFLDHHVAYWAKFDRVEQRLTANQQLCNDIVSTALDFYRLDRSELQSFIHDSEAQGHVADKTAVSQALKHIVRDWTQEGRHERHLPFACMLDTVDSLFPARQAAEPLRALLPGAGLGRLGHQLDRLGGFQVTINEWSMFMNVVYRFLDTHGLQDQHSLYPFVDGWSHHATDADMLRKLSFPDDTLDPRSVLLVEGDFTTVFAHQHGHYHLVLTYFFIDTARNLMSYLDTIKKLLKSGGYWLNLGPLLYGTAPFVQLSLEDIITITKAMGFEFDHTDDKYGPLTFQGSTVRSIEAIYGFDNKALTKNSYNAQFWVAKKL
ncbi:hypothetical protein CDD81_4520 [Ophiocordyceps australis]|uniref:Uncharacterized protein n=1 Tax=Ophiocordyceps australis TaxID=1399860 RepID=A0A2C5Y4M1_9HYPO|nr:hypothetical protein CDD81_4520 [Ophiocordyceps australis]